MIPIQKISLPIMLLGPILAATFGAGASIAVTRAQLEDIREKAQASEARVERMQAEKAAQGERIKGVEVALEHIAKALERIERKLGTK